MSTVLSRDGRCHVHRAVMRSRRAAEHQFRSSTAVRLLAAAGVACGTGREPEAQEGQPMPDVTSHEVASADTVPIPEPLASLCVRPDRTVGWWSHTITGVGARVPLAREYRSIYSDLETPLRCVARTAEEKAVLLGHTFLADSAHWRDPGTMVLLAARGFVSHLGPRIHLCFVTEHGDSLIAYVVRPEGGGGCTVPEEVTYPISVVAIPLSEANVVFREYALWS